VNVVKQQALTWLRTLGWSSLPIGLAAFGMIGTAFHWPHATLWLILAVLLLLLICLFVGRDIRSVLFGIYGCGLVIIFLIMAGPHFVQSLVLSTSGQTVQARVTEIATDTAYPGSSDLGCRSCSHTHGYVFKTAAGQTLPGYPYGNSVLHTGDQRPVVIDPRGRIDSRAPQEVQPWRDGLWLLLSLAITIGLCWQSSQAREQRKAYHS